MSDEQPARRNARAQDARPSRGQEEAAAESGERRRRGGADNHKTRLFAPLDMLDTKKFHYRWITNDPARVFQLTQQDDYDVVPAAELGAGRVKTEHALKGGDGDGNPLSQVLVRKRRDWYEKDKRDEQTALEQDMEALKAGAVPKGELLAAAHMPKGESAENAYRTMVDNDFNAARGEFEP